jgi:hypothetical protein
MAANINPIAVLQPVNSTDGTNTTASPLGVTLTTGFNDFTGVNAQVVFTANPVEGGRLSGITLAPTGTNVASLIRIFVNNGGAVGTAANNRFIYELGLPATTASATTAGAVLEVPLGSANFKGYNLQPSFRVLAQLATTVAGGWSVSPAGGGRF